jgi:hypothetical protein
MFIRQRDVNGTAYFSIVETFRDGGKVHQRTVVSLGQCPTIDEAIAECRGWAEQYRHNATRHGGRELFGTNDGGYIVLPIGNEAKRRAEKLEAKIALLTNCRTVMAKPVLQGDTFYHYIEGVGQLK